MGIVQGLSPQQRLDQTQVLSASQQLGLSLLQKTCLELRTELQAQALLNPVIDEIVWKKEIPMSNALPQEHMSAELSSKPLDLSQEKWDEMRSLNTDDSDRDQFFQNLDNYEHSSENGSYDSDAAEKRQLIFDRQVKEETLPEHLLSQVPLADLSPEDQAICETLIPSINDEGIFDRSLADIQMVTGKSEKHLLRLLKVISTFDPIGCGGRNLRETLLYQMSKLDDSPWEDEVRKLIDCHLDDLIKGKKKEICADLGIELDQFPLVIGELRKLSRKPGLGFSPSVSPDIYIEPEVFLERTKSGKWKVRVPERNVPDIRVSPFYLKRAANPNITPEEKKFLAEKFAAVETLRDAIADRQETIRKIAQTIVDHQHEVFDKMDKSALKPLTQEEVAQIVDLHNSTVSRTVCNKYMSTPLGSIELRKFFVSGVKTADGESTVSVVSVMEQIRKIIENEDKKHPLSDQKISDELSQKGIQCARRTVVKYRESMHIPNASGRKQV